MARLIGVLACSTQMFQPLFAASRARFLRVAAHSGEVHATTGGRSTGGGSILREPCVSGQMSRRGERSACDIDQESRRGLTPTPGMLVTTG